MEASATRPRPGSFRPISPVPCRRRGRRISGGPRGRSAGFTLVEMLAVVVIIGILAGLITAAAVRARVAARRAAMMTELRDLEMAINTYKNEMGDYPPDFTDLAAVQRHLATAFPGFTFDANFVQSAFGNRNVFNPSSALVFWLGGIPDSNNIPSGFSANPRNPFEPPVANQATGRKGPYFDFDTSRLYNAGTCTINLSQYGVQFQFPVFQYYAKGLPLGSAPTGYGPFVYFRARSTGGYDPYNANQQMQQVWPPLSFNQQERIRPCLDTRAPQTPNPVFVNPKTFQIRCPGPDGRFGSGVRWPTGEDYDPPQYDDMGNFGEGTFGDMIP